MVKTSSIHYIHITKQGYEDTPCIPTGQRDGDSIEVLCFMSKNPERKVFIRREDIFTNQHVEQLKLI